ncbi:MAG: ubiquitin-like protein [Clostridia bacterium]
MNIEKINPNIKYVYHYTLKKNVKKILNDKAIKSKDQYVFFTKSLNDSIIAFEREMMQENKLYIDVEGNLRKREKCNKDDYCILKIPYINDNQFYKFNFENQSKESIYTISISHKGSYKFKEAKVLEFPKNRKLNVLSKTAVAAIVAGIMLFPYNAYAASWLDTNNYDISWYVDETYVINTAEQMAGLAHLVNNENKTFTGKNICINEDIDLTANTWETIKDIFKGTIEGSHRIILNYLDGKLVENKDISLVEYSYKILEDKNNLKNVVIGMPYTVEKLKLSTGARAVFLNNKELSNDQSLLNLTENDIIEVFTGNYNIFIKDSKGIILPFYFESGDSIENIKTKYSEKANIPKNKIILKYNEKELEDERTFADYNISTKQYITLDAYVKFDINISVEEGKGNIISSKNTALSGEKITITLNPDSEYELSKLIVNGIEKTNEVQNNELNIECGDEDINVKVSYKLKEKEEESKDNVDKVEEEPKDNIEIKDKTEENVLISNPATGDNIIKYIIAFITSIVGIVICKCKKIMKK